jgi:bifunctional non-homologous end joining protein LigD
MSRPALKIPRDLDNATLRVGRRDVRVTNLRKVFWPDLGLTKGDLLQYYADVAAIGRWS